MVDALLLRFLRARKFDIKLSTDMLNEDISFRLANNVPSMLTQSLQDVYDNPDVTYSQIAAYYPHATIGFDKKGQPVTYKLWGTFEVWSLKKLTSLENLCRFHIWEQEQLYHQLMLQQSERASYNCETMVAVIDISGMRLKQITKDFLFVMKNMASTDQNHYPERMGTTYIINCPSMFSVVWRGIVPWINKDTAAKIKILASEKEWRPVLEEAIGLDMLPPLYGGSNKNVASSMKQYFGVEDDSLTDVTEAQPSEYSMYDQFDQYESKPLPQESPGTNTSRRLSKDNNNNSPRDDNRCVSPPTDETMRQAYGKMREDKEDTEDPRERLSDHSERTSTKSDDYHSAHGHHSANHSQNGENELFSDLEAGEGAVEKKPTCYSRLCAVCAPFRLCTDRKGRSHLKNRVLQWPLKRLCIAADAFNVILCGMSIGIIVIISLFLASDRWETETDVVEELFWIFVVTVVLASIMLLAGFLGILAIHSQNFHLLKFHQVTLNSITVFLTSVCIVSIIYGANLNNIVNDRVESSMTEAASSWFKKMHFVIAGLSGGMALFSFVPGLFCSSLRIRFRAIVNRAAQQGITDVFYRSNMQRILQLRTVLRCTNSMALFFALSCIIFGFYGVRQGLTYELEFSVYVPFLLAELGLVLVIMSMAAFWASGSKEPKVFRTYQFLAVPFIMTLIGLCILSFFQVKLIDGYGTADPELRTAEEARRIAAKAKATVVVSGVLEAVTAFFYLQNLIVSRKLFDSLVKSTRAVSFRRTQLLNEYGVEDTNEELQNVSRAEYFVAVMCLANGMMYMFFDGSYLLFSDYIHSNGGGWATVLWQEVAKIDARYLDSGPFILSQNCFSCFLFGPSCLVYAWALLTRKHYTHVFGVTLSTSILTSQLLYFMTAFAEDWGFFEFNPNKTSLLVRFWFVIVNVLCRLAFPLFLSVFEHKRAIGLRFEHEDLSIRLKKEEDQLSLDAAEVLFGASTDDLTRLVNDHTATGGRLSPTRGGDKAGSDRENGGRGDLVRRRPSTPFTRL
jgi:hypothetical protein